MSPTTSLTLYVRPVITRFVIAKLGDLERVQYTSCGVELWQVLNTELQLPVAHVSTDRRDKPTPRLFVNVLAPDAAPIDVTTNNLVSSRMERIFRADLCRTIDFIRGYMRIGKKEAIEYFAQVNGIHIGVDVPFHSLQRLYWKHEKKSAIARA